MVRRRAWWVVGVSLAACTVGSDEGGFTGPGLGPGGVVTDDDGTANGTASGTASGSGTGGQGTADGSSGGADGPPQTTGGCEGTPGNVALGGTCMDPCDCASGNCFTIAVGSACSECTSDAQCMADGGVGTCSADFTLDPPYARCTGGELGVMCQLGSGGCQAGLVCAQILDTMGFLPDYFCSQCETSADCNAGLVCVPVIVYGGIAISSGSLQCVAPSSLADGALCPLLPSGLGDGSVCVSGHCAVTDVAGLGIVEIGVCSSCAGDEDCMVGQTCMGANVDENGTTPAACG
jgi:hypothetical protein